MRIQLYGWHTFLSRLSLSKKWSILFFMEREKISRVLDIFEETYPDAECALHHQNVFQLIVAVALSAQTTDKSVNQVTPALFAAYPDAFALGKADPEEVSEYIRRIGMYRTKAKNI